MFLGEIILYNPGKKIMNKADLEDENVRLRALVAQHEKTAAEVSRTVAHLKIQVSDLQHSNQYLARVADDYRCALGDERAKHTQVVNRLAQETGKILSETVREAARMTELAVERVRSDTLAQCFDRALDKLAS